MAALDEIESDDDDVIFVDNDKMKNDSKECKTNTTNNTNFLQNLSKNAATKQLAFGAGSGWVTGFVTSKVGRTMAFVIGGSIIAFQIAQNQGYINMNWEKLREKAEIAKKEQSQSIQQTKNLTNRLKTFARTNSAFTAGFVGGFLIGIAT